jgi:hypothetical protein
MTQEIELRHGRGDRRDELGQDTVLLAKQVTETGGRREVIEADDHVDPGV